MVRNTMGSKLKIKVHQDDVVLAVESKGFCVSLNEDNKTAKVESNKVKELCKPIQHSLVSWVDYVADNLESEAEDIAHELGFSKGLVKNLMKNEKRGSYLDKDHEMGILVPAVIVDKFDVKVNPLLILIKKNLVLTLHGTEVRRFFHLRRYAETMMRKIKVVEPSQDKVTKIVIRILDENNGRNFDHLREIEENGDRLSSILADPKTPRSVLGPEIYNMKHALVVYLGALWSTLDVLNSLRYGDPELLTDDERILDHVGALANEISTQISLAEHLSDVLASGLEVLQSIYNNQLQVLNNKLAMAVTYLTIIGTALIVPNTIATVMSSSAFAMGPQDVGWYLALLLGSTVVATVFAYILVKKLGWMPKKPDEG